MMRFLRRFKDLGIQGFGARWYDKNTREHRMWEMKSYAEYVSGCIQDGDRVLDVAPGPGFLAIELAKLGNFAITGVDISSDFVDIARRNAHQAGVHIDFRQGNASHLPLADSSFDFVLCTAAFKNFREPLQAMNEMYRVLKPGGVALIIDMNANASNDAIHQLTEEMDVHGVELLFLKFTFKHFLRRGAYDEDEFTRLISLTRFGSYDIKPDGVAFWVTLRK